MNVANALARLTPASGPPPRIPSGFGGCVGGFWGGFWGRFAAAQRPQNPPKNRITFKRRKARTWRT